LADSGLCLLVGATSIASSANDCRKRHRDDRFRKCRRIILIAVWEFMAMLQTPVLRSSATTSPDTSRAFGAIWLMLDHLSGLMILTSPALGS
jgi:hypothetical protein